MLLIFIQKKDHSLSNIILDRVYDPVWRFQKLSFSVDKSNRKCICRVPECIFTFLLVIKRADGRLGLYGCTNYTSGSHLGKGSMSHTGLHIRDVCYFY